MGALVELEPRRLPAVPGAPVTVQVRVRNSGSVVDQFDLGVLGDAQAWATVEPASLSLFPGAEGSATVTFAPPRSPQLAAGPMVFGLRAQSKEDPAGSVVEEGTLDVEPFTDVFAELVPRASRGSSGATHDLAVDNRGNVALDAAISALDPDRLLDFELRPPTVTAEPGTAAFAKVGVKPKKRFWRGGAATRPFQVQVDVPGGTPLVLDGSLLQTPILPPWTLRALAIALVLLVAVVAAWATLIKPAIESTARQQAEDVLAEVGITPLPSGATPDGSSGQSSAPTPDGSGGTGSPDPSAGGASSAPSSPPGAGGATPKDGRLVRDGTLTPSAGTTLYLTDLVFSNPGVGAAGDIRLERAGEPLLVLRLANFRDLDYHFVTPIAVGDGQELRLVCTDTCPDAAMYYSGYERSP
jgi:hypothetical protein